MGSRLVLLVLMIQVAKNEGVGNKKNGLVHLVQANEETNQLQEIKRLINEATSALKTELQATEHFNRAELKVEMKAARDTIKAEMSRETKAARDTMKKEMNSEMEALKAKILRCTSGNLKWDVGNYQRKRLRFTPAFKLIPKMSYGLMGHGAGAIWLTAVNLAPTHVDFVIKQGSNGGGDISVQWMACGYGPINAIAIE